jgi:hypothetical protein
MPDLVSAHINACALMMTEKAADLIQGAARARVFAETGIDASGWKPQLIETANSP